MSMSAAAHNLLAVRLGAMGDVIHTLPAVASLKHGMPESRITWVVSARWADLLEGNPFVDRVIRFDRRSVASLAAAARELRQERYHAAVDFQGLIQSALVAAAARPERIYGYHRSEARESAAALFYSNPVMPKRKHIVERHLELARAAGAASFLIAFPLPEGDSAGGLPEGPYVLASPLAGWVSKQWPLANYAVLAARLDRELGVPLVIDGPPSSAPALEEIRSARLHQSDLRGLIAATRRAAAVVGVDSGPMHLAAALGKPGVALFGPTDPERNGPYGGSLTVLRSRNAVTSYKRRNRTDPAMLELSPDMVFERLKGVLQGRVEAAGKC
jgi:heptosyltransferase-1